MTDTQALIEREEYQLEAKIWKRLHTNEWVLQLTGAMNDTAFTVRHTEPLTTPPEEVASLPTLTTALTEAEAKLAKARVALRRMEEAPLISEELRLMASSCLTEVGEG